LRAVCQRRRGFRRCLKGEYKKNQAEPRTSCRLPHRSSHEIEIARGPGNTPSAAYTVVSVVSWPSTPPPIGRSSALSPILRTPKAVTHTRWNRPTSRSSCGSSGGEGRYRNRRCHCDGVRGQELTRRTARTSDPNTLTPNLTHRIAQCRQGRGTIVDADQHPIEPLLRRVWRNRYQLLLHAQGTGRRQAEKELTIAPHAAAPRSPGLLIVMDVTNRTEPAAQSLCWPDDSRWHQHGRDGVINMAPR